MMSLVSNRIGASLMYPFVILLAGLSVVTCTFVHTHHSCTLNVASKWQQEHHQQGFRMATSVTPGKAIEGSPVLKSILKKPSKMLTVGVEYSSTSKTSVSSSDLSILSMQLRKAKVSAIWSSNTNELKVFVQEQESAKGNFPGPCPIIYHGTFDSVDEAVSAGASAVVLDAKSLRSTGRDNAFSTAITSVVAPCEIIWEVASEEDVRAVLDATEQNADAFFIPWDTGNPNSIELHESLVPSLPKGALWIAGVAPMQPDGAEISQAKVLKQLGYASIVVGDACVGDEEDLGYAGFIVQGMTSKASSEFKFSGLTGSTNGHFGGVQALGTANWRRQASIIDKHKEAVE